MNCAWREAAPVALVLLGATIISAAATAPAATPADLQAALTILGAKNRARSDAELCEATLGQNGKAFRFLEHYWESANYELLHGAELVWISMPSPGQADATKRLDADGARFTGTPTGKIAANASGECSNIAASLNARTFGLDRVTADDQQRLQMLYRRNGDKDAFRDDNMTTGCMAGAYRKGATDFNAVMRFCECVTQALVTSGSSAEIDKYLADAGKSDGTNPDALTGQSWFPVANAKLKACAAIKP